MVYGKKIENTVGKTLTDFNERLVLEDFLGVDIYLKETDRKSPAVLMFIMLIEMAQRNHREGLAWLGKAKNWGISLEEGLQKQLETILDETSKR